MLKRRAKSARKSRAKSASMSGLVRKLDTVFSRFVRMSWADEGGTVRCVTCGKLLHWKESHASHFCSRRHMSTRWDKMNVHPCCPRCNVFEYGALDEYSRFIIDTYGREAFDALLSSKRETKKWTRPELEGLIRKYESAAREQESRLSGMNV